MKFAVVGVGSIGSRYVAYLKDAGHEVFTVDPFRAAEAVDVESIRKSRRVDAWIVATPTETHVQTVRKILAADAGARILLEKPVCSPGELSTLRNVCAQHPAAGILVNDVYAHSHVVRLFADTVRAVSAFRDISRVVIEFTKNRAADEDLGRFVDRDYGEVGYEWFHLLSLLRTVLPPAAYTRYLATAQLRPPPNLRARMAAPGLPEIDLYASMSGQIAFADAAGFAYRGPAALKCLEEAAIPYASAFRYRFARVEFSSQASVTLAFESDFGLVDDHKNTHSIHVCDELGRRSFTVTGNHLSHALFSQLAVLVNSSGGMVELSPREHLHMAAVALRVKEGAGQSNFHPEGVEVSRA